MRKLCPLNKWSDSGEFRECIEESCAWYDDGTGGCEITNLSLISKMSTEEWKIFKDKQLEIGMEKAPVIL